MSNNYLNEHLAADKPKTKKNLSHLTILSIIFFGLSFVATFSTLFVAASIPFLTLGFGILFALYGIGAAVLSLRER